VTMTASVSSGRAQEIERLMMDGTPTETVAKQFGVTPSRIYQILGQTTKRKQVLLFLLEHKDEKYTSKEIANAVQVDIKKVEFQVDRLHKRGRVKATQKKTVGEAGDHKMWVDIQLTTPGIAEARTLLPKTNGKTEPLIAQISTEDVADLHPFVAERVPEQVITNVGPDQQDRAHELAREHAAAVAGHVVPFRDQAIADAALDEVEGAHTAKPSAIAAQHTLAASDIPRFPFIYKLVEKATRISKLTAAAKLLEEAEEVDLALSVMGKAEMSPLEREVVAFVELYGKDLKES
jgi:hypothetical protein